MADRKATAGFFKVYSVQPRARPHVCHWRGPRLDATRSWFSAAALRQRRFGGDGVGRGAQDSARRTKPYDVIGVMPVGFYSFFSRTTDLRHQQCSRPEQVWRQPADQRVARRRRPSQAGIGIEQAKRDVTAFADGLKRDFPDWYPRQWTIVANSMNEMSTRRIRTALLILVGAVGFVLLIACANIANLLLARAASRTREVAVRAAVGATRTDLIRQLLAESVLLSVVGAVVGLAIASGAVRASMTTVPVDLLRVEAIQIDGTVLVVHACGGGRHGPAVWYRPGDPCVAHRSARRVQGRRADRGRRTRAMAAPRSGRRRGGACADLLVGAGLLIRSFAMLQGVNPGFDPRNLVTVDLSLPPQITRHPSRAPRSSKR